MHEVNDSSILMKSSLLGTQAHKISSIWKYPPSHINGHVSSAKGKVCVCACGRHAQDAIAGTWFISHFVALKFEWIHTLRISFIKLLKRCWNGLTSSSLTKSYSNTHAHGHTPSLCVSALAKTIRVRFGKQCKPLLHLARLRFCVWRTNEDYSHKPQKLRKQISSSLMNFHIQDIFSHRWQCDDGWQRHPFWIEGTLQI